MTAGRVTTHLATPAFVADPHSIIRNTGRQIDWDAIDDSYRETAAETSTVTLSASAAQSATTIAVTALPAFLPDNTVLDFGGAKYARVNGAKEAGATSVTVDALPTALASADAATYNTAPRGGPKILPAGTCVGTLAGGGKLRPRVVSTNPAVGFLEAGAREDDRSASLSGYGVIIGGHLYENLLPDASGGPPATIAAGIKTELDAARAWFSYETYADSRDA
jgi:hypothetical protein